MSSAISFNFDRSKILSSGDVLNTWVKVEMFQNTENLSWGAWGLQGPQWVQGKALVRGPGGLWPPGVPEI